VCVFDGCVVVVAVCVLQIVCDLRSSVAFECLYFKPKIVIAFFEGETSNS
jgi:hypothetical protein